MPRIGILLIFEVFGVCAIEAGNGFFSRRCTHLLKGFVGHCLGISIEFDLPSQKISIVFVTRLGSVQKVVFQLRGDFR
jgi:hypothetical protein